MHNWFECKVSYEKMMENGMQKKVTEPYLVDALSFTEAESRIIEEIRPFITGEFTITDIKRARISEIFFNESALFLLGVGSFMNSPALSAGFFNGFSFGTADTVSVGDWAI